MNVKMMIFERSLGSVSLIADLATEWLLSLGKEFEIGNTADVV